MPYVVVEGVDGSGKTTLAKALFRKFMDTVGDAEFFVEPSKDPGGIGAEIRRRATDGPILEPWEALGLFVADRRMQVDRRLKPALATGRFVVQDRNWLSTAVYQGCWGRRSTDHVSEKPLAPSPLWIADLHASFCPTPDLVVLLDLPAADVAKRLAVRGGKDQYDAAGLEEIQSRVDRYRELHDNPDPAWWKKSAIVDATMPFDLLLEQVWLIVADATGLPL